MSLPPFEHVVTEHARVVLRVCRALPDKQRLAVAYRYVADLAYADVAAAMGTSEAAARRNAADGVKALRRRYPTPSEERV